MENSLTQTELISYCGFYCGACPKFTKGQCEGCKGDSTKCAVGYKDCKVRPCCIENGFKSCADCDKIESVKDCKLFNPFMIRFGQFITRTNRRLGIEMIKESGESGFVKYMIDKNWVTIKTGVKPFLRFYDYPFFHGNNLAFCQVMKNNGLNRFPKEFGNMISREYFNFCTDSR